MVQYGDKNLDLKLQGRRFDSLSLQIPQSAFAVFNKLFCIKAMSSNFAGFNFLLKNKWIKMLNPAKLLLIALIWFCKSTSWPKLNCPVFFNNLCSFFFEISGMHSSFADWLHDDVIGCRLRSQHQGLRLVLLMLPKFGYWSELHSKLVGADLTGLSRVLVENINSSKYEPLVNKTTKLQYCPRMGIKC